MSILQAKMLQYSLVDILVLYSYTKMQQKLLEIQLQVREYPCKSFVIEFVQVYRITTHH